MKILLMSSSFNGGGITSFGHEVANAYSKDNNFSIIIGSDAKVPIENNRVKKYYYNCDNLSISNSKNIIRLINEEIKPDVIIGSNAKVLSVIAQFLNESIKIITFSHSSKYIESDAAAVAHRHIDHIIAGSEYNKQLMKRKFGVKDKSKIQVIYNFVKDHPEHEKIIRNKKQSKEISIVFPGACSSSKSPEIVLQIVRKLVMTDLNFKFYWMGRHVIHLSRYFPFLHVNDIRELAPKDPRVVFPGRFPSRQDAEDLIASGNIQLSPSRREGCPMSLLEAIRVGTIAIVADFGIFNREIVEKGNFGFIFHHNDIDGFANKIIEICKNLGKYSYMYDNAYNTFITELNYDTWKKKMDMLIYSEDHNHTPRGKSVSTLKLILNIARLKILIIESNIKKTLFEDLKVLYRMWKLKHKSFIRNNN